MTHPTEEQLVSYYYGDAEGSEALGRHLDSCAGCRAVFEDVQRALAEVNATTVPERGEDYGAEVWRKLQPQISEQAPSPWAALFVWRRWALGGAMAALVALAFLAGRYSSRGHAPETAALSKTVRQRILLVAVSGHLDRSEMALIELENADGTGPADISDVKHMAEELIPSNRLYRQTAASSGDTRMATVLDELGRALIEIAHSPSNPTPAQLEEIRQRIQAQGILFKIRVVDSQVREREKSLAAAPEGKT